VTQIAVAEAATLTAAIDEMIQIVAAAGMILIEVVGTMTLADVAILIVAQPTRRVAEFAVAMAMAAATGATGRDRYDANF
jgi:hypothetical protein